MLRVLALSLLLVAGGARTAEVTILRDAWGTPQVFAGDNYGVYLGYGYAVAQDRLYQMEMLKRTTQGRVAEVLGAEFLELDIHIRTAYDHRAVSHQLEALPARDLALLEAWAHGFNRRIDEVRAEPAQMPLGFSENDFRPEHWTAYDVAMLFVGSILHRYSDFNSELDNLALLGDLSQRHGPTTAGHIFDASKWLYDATSPTTVPRREETIAHVPERGARAPSALHDAGTKRIVIDEHGRFQGLTSKPGARLVWRKQVARYGLPAQPGFAGASNYWAVGRSKAEGAEGISINGPQFGWSVPSYVYGIGLHGGDFNVTGNTLLALPCILFAHNGHVAWGSTAGLSDQVDVYIEKLNPDDPGQYLHGGEWRDFESWPETIYVNGAQPVEVTARRSVHGMIQAMNKAENVAYSRARAWEGAEVQSLMTWINLARDRSLDAIRKRLENFAGNINFYYMDTRGNLGYTHGGRYPERQDGHDPRLPVSGTGEMDWKGYRPYSENPAVRNPQQGYIANWNNRPGPGWPASDLWSQTWGRGDRATFIFDNLQAGDRFTVDELWAINRRLAYRDVSMPFLSPYLFAAWEGLPASDRIQQALSLLRDWDQRWTPDSLGRYPPAAALSETWLRVLLREVFFDDIGADFFHLYAATNNPVGPLGPSMGTAPGVKALIRNLDRLRADENPGYDFFNHTPPSQILRHTFNVAVARLTEQQGEDMQAWALPAHPMRWSPYNFRGVPQASDSMTVSIPGYMNRGSENNLFIARHGGFRAYDVIPPGQSGDRTAQGISLHTEDQMPMFTGWRYKPVPFTREEADTLAVEKTVLDYRR